MIGTIGPIYTLMRNIFDIRGRGMYKTKICNTVIVKKVLYPNNCCAFIGQH